METNTILFIIWVVLSSIMMGLSIFSLVISKSNQNEIKSLKDFINPSQPDQNSPTKSV